MLCSIKTELLLGYVGKCPEYKQYLVSLSFYFMFSNWTGLLSFDVQQTIFEHRQRMIDAVYTGPKIFGPIVTATSAHGVVPE